MKFKAALLCSAALVVCASPSDSSAQANRKPAQPVSVSSLQKTIESQQQRLNNQEKLLQSQQAEMQNLKKMMQQMMKQNATPVVATNAIAANAKQKTLEVRQPTSTSPGSPETVAQVGLKRRPLPRETPVQIAAVPKDGGVLLQPGKMVIEPMLEYSRSSALTVAIEGFTIIPALNIGSFDISQVDRDTITSAISARLGLFPRFEISGRIPYIYRDDTFSSRPIGTLSLIHI